MDLHLNHNLNVLPLGGFLLDIFTDLLGILIMARNEVVLKMNIIRIYFLTKPKGPNLGAREEAAPGSPPLDLRITIQEELDGEIKGKSYRS